MLWGILALITALHAQTPTVTILSPAPGEVVAGSAIQFEALVPRNFTVGEDGYLRFWLDARERLPENAVLVEQGTKHTFERVPGGLHTLFVELIRSDRTSFSPKVEAAVEFENLGEALKSGGGGAPLPPDNEPPPGPPRGSGNTALVVIVTALAIAILWLVVGRKKT